MILADEPAFSLPPISRAMKFADFDRLLARLVNDSKPPAGAMPAEPGPPLAGEMSGIDQPPPPDVTNGHASHQLVISRMDDSEGAGGGDGGDYWADGSTEPGGWFGEVELTPVGAVPVAELEG